MRADVGNVQRQVISEGLLNAQGPSRDSAAIEEIRSYSHRTAWPGIASNTVAALDIKNG